ncbi:putative protein C16orf45 [Liparis tanakae]|uniref:BMERB domain-containing protein n=1 Tax=Liparis tanakae TaxID=230148 RepID=A0A4Z2GZP3_9TELE|nr:putative protein C16orf45 [Liparis tanakae]
MERESRPCGHYGSLEETQVDETTQKSTEDVISMADSTITIGNIEGELCKIERIRDILVRRESELRYMMDDIQLCKEITRLKAELQKLVSISGATHHQTVASKARKTPPFFPKTGLTLLKDCCGFTCSIM